MRILCYYNYTFSPFFIAYQNYGKVSARTPRTLPAGAYGGRRPFAILQSAIIYFSAPTHYIIEQKYIKINHKILFFILIK